MTWSEHEKLTDGQTDRQTDGQTYRRTDNVTILYNKSKKRLPLETDTQKLIESPNITKTFLFKYAENFATKKMKKIG